MSAHSCAIARRKHERWVGAVSSCNLNLKSPQQPSHIEPVPMGMVQNRRLSSAMKAEALRELDRAS